MTKFCKNCQKDDHSTNECRGAMSFRPDFQLAYVEPEHYKVGLKIAERHYNPTDLYGNPWLPWGVTVGGFTDTTQWAGTVGAM